MGHGPHHLVNKIKSSYLDEVTLAEAFRQSDYATGLFGKWNLGKWYPYQPNVQVFDEFVGFRSGADLVRILDDDRYYVRVARLSFIVSN